MAAKRTTCKAEQKKIKCFWKEKFTEGFVSSGTEEALVDNTQIMNYSDLLRKQI